MLFRSGRHECRSPSQEIVGMQTQDVLVPLARSLSVPDINVHMTQVTRCVTHHFSPITELVYVGKVPQMKKFAQPASLVFMGGPVRGKRAQANGQRAVASVFPRRRG